MLTFWTQYIVTKYGRDQHLDEIKAKASGVLAGQGSYGSRNKGLQGGVSNIDKERCSLKETKRKDYEYSTCRRGKRENRIKKMVRP